MDLGLPRNCHPDNGRTRHTPARVQLFVVDEDPVHDKHLAGTEARCSAANQFYDGAPGIHSVETANSRWRGIEPRGSEFRQARR